MNDVKYLIKRGFKNFNLRFKCDKCNFNFNKRVIFYPFSFDYVKCPKCKNILNPYKPKRIISYTKNDKK